MNLGSWRCAGGSVSSNGFDVEAMTVGDYLASRFER
jgi:hypothetical protein